jgi:hypothetical protein
MPQGHLLRVPGGRSGSLRDVTDSTLPVHPAAAVLNPLTLSQFLVDTAGVVVPGSLKFIKTSDQVVPQLTRETIHLWRYVPAQRQGERVCQLVQAPVELTPPS